MCVCVCESVCKETLLKLRDEAIATYPQVGGFKGERGRARKREGEREGGRERGRARGKMKGEGVQVLRRKRSTTPSTHSHTHGCRSAH